MMTSIHNIDLDYFNLLDDPLDRLNELLAWANRPVDKVVDYHHKVRGDSNPHTALHDGAAESTLHGNYQGEEAGDTGWDKEGVGDGGQAAGYQPKVYGVAEEVGGRVTERDGLSGKAADWNWEDTRR